MPLISISKAAKLFNVSRPTLQKALKDGVISGEKVKYGGSESWQIDTAELARVYSIRHTDPEKIVTDGMESLQHLSVKNISDYTPLSAELSKGLESLTADLEKARADLEKALADQVEAQKELAAAQAVAEERKRLLDDVMRLLPPPAPADQSKTTKRRSWWPWGR